MSSNVQRPGVNQALSIECCQDWNHSDWDSFLTTVSGDNHLQTSLWARVMAAMGWRVSRVVARRQDVIVGGAQVLFKSSPRGAGIGYVYGGPVVSEVDTECISSVIQALRRLARIHRITALVVRLPSGGDRQSNHMLESGFAQSSIEMDLEATLVLDLSVGEEALLNNMAARTRYNVRLGGRRGVVVRDGCRADLRSYLRLLHATARRQGFTPPPRRFFYALWDELEPAGHVRLFVAEYKGEVLVAQLAVVFGDTVVNKLTVWSGEQGSRKPNETIQWHAIRWALERGYRYFDLNGIDPAVARSVLRDGSVPDRHRRSPSAFKIGFGGRAVLFPVVLDYFYVTGLRAFYVQARARLHDLRLSDQTVSIRRGFSAQRPSVLSKLRSLLRL